MAGLLQLCPASFPATLTEAGSWLTDTTSETGAQGKTRGRVLGATLQGRRTARSVTFLKLYADGFPAYDGVHYEGEVCEDGTEIEGAGRSRAAGQESS